MPKAEIKNPAVAAVIGAFPEATSSNENLTLEPEQRAPQGVPLSNGPKIGSRDNGDAFFEPASYKVPDLKIAQKEGPAVVVSGIVRTDR